MLVVKEMYYFYSVDIRVFPYASLCTTEITLVPIQILYIVIFLKIKWKTFFKAPPAANEDYTSLISLLFLESHNHCFVK